MTIIINRCDVGFIIRSFSRHANSARAHAKMLAFLDDVKYNCFSVALPLRRSVFLIFAVPLCKLHHLMFSSIIALVAVNFGSFWANEQFAAFLVHIKTPLRNCNVLSKWLEDLLQIPFVQSSFAVESIKIRKQILNMLQSGRTTKRTKRQSSTSTARHSIINWKRDETTWP